MRKKPEEAWIEAALKSISEEQSDALYHGPNYVDDIIAEWLRKAIAFGYQAAKPKWISVEDRLPEMRQDVMCWGRDKIFFAQRDDYANDMWDSEYAGYYWTDGDEYYYRASEVTHWMPLPEGPK